jgi:succinoglycan biosynthesis protein ExoM
MPFESDLQNGLTYRVSGHRNISIARNLAIETAAMLGDWVAMTDDDCEPSAGWLRSLLTVQRQTKADAVTGLMVRRVPAGSPEWITSQPFLTFDAANPLDEQEMTTAFTNNAMISSSWLLAHPEHRFDPRLGRIGGEDMAFFRAARAAGLKIHFSSNGFVFENEPEYRTTFRYQLRRFYWHGNSTYVTMLAQGTRPTRALIHGVATLARALIRPAARLCRRKPPQCRYTLATILLSFGIISGYLGIRVRHR